MRDETWMTNFTPRLSYWAPRVVGLLFAAFVGVFALDVLDEDLGAWRMSGALLIHLLPTFVLLLVLGIAWRLPRAGAALYVALGLFYNLVAPDRMPFSARAAISAPLFLIAALFVFEWVSQHGLRAANSGE